MNKLKNLSFLLIVSSIFSLVHAAAAKDIDPSVSDDKDRTASLNVFVGNWEEAFETKLGVIMHKPDCIISAIRNRMGGIDITSCKETFTLACLDKNNSIQTLYVNQSREDFIKALTLVGIYPYKCENCSSKKDK